VPGILATYVIALGTLTLAACGASTSEPAPAQSANGVTSPFAVKIQTFQYSPGTLDVAAGSTVVWTNDDDIDHTVTSGMPDRAVAEFDGSLDGAGTTFSFTFHEVGFYPYFCDIHSVMRGTIRVT
jgi:plastocyanin